MKTTDIVSQIDKLLVEYGQLKQRSQYDDLSDLENESQALVIRLRAALDRLAPGANSYAKEMAKVDDDPKHVRIVVYVGILQALRTDIADGWVEGIAELINAATFDDLIDQASELLNKGYKDAAAVVIGSTLEAHLRLLGVKYGLPTRVPTGQTKKADTINGDLVKASAYNTLQQKAVTAWLGIRNSAAHGKYTEYDASQVTSMLASVRDFIARYPA